MYVCYYVNNSHFLSLHNVTRSRNVSKFPWLPWAMYTLITFSISVSASDSFVGGAAPSANVAPAMNFPTRAMSDGRERSCKVCTGWAVAARKLHVHNDLILRRNKYCTYVRLRDLFCIISVCSLRLFSSFLSGFPKERFSDVGVSFHRSHVATPFPRRYRDVGTTGAGSRAHTGGVFSRGAPSRGYARLGVPSPQYGDPGFGVHGAFFTSPGGTVGHNFTCTRDQWLTQMPKTFQPCVMRSGCTLKSPSIALQQISISTAVPDERKSH
jgi:hypothetical protein